MRLKLLLLSVLSAILFFGSAQYDGYTRPDLEGWFTLSSYHNSRVNMLHDSITRYQRNAEAIIPHLYMRGLTGNEFPVSLETMIEPLFIKLSPKDIQASTMLEQKVIFNTLYQRELTYKTLLNLWKDADSIYLVHVRNTLPYRDNDEWEAVEN